MPGTSHHSPKTMGNSPSSGFASTASSTWNTRRATASTWWGYRARLACWGRWVSSTGEQRWVQRSGVQGKTAYESRALDSNLALPSLEWPWPACYPSQDLIFLLCGMGTVIPVLTSFSGPLSFITFIKARFLSAKVVASTASWAMRLESVDRWEALVHGSCQDRGLLALMHWGVPQRVEYEADVCSSGNTVVMDHSSPPPCPMAPESSRARPTWTWSHLAVT